MFHVIGFCLGSLSRCFHSRQSLLLENLALRQQLAVLKRRHPRPRLSLLDRLFWVLARRFWSAWKQALLVVTPETVVRWHRAGFRLYWSLISRVSRQVGRKTVSKELRNLIFQMVAENPTWGAPRIHGELLMLGFAVSERTIMFPLIQIGNDFVGNALFDYIDGIATSIIQAKGFAADELPVFVTGNAIAQALGYHSAFSVTNPDNSVSLDTYIYTSWLDPALAPSIFADVSTFNHENLEWMNDPFLANVVPVWKYPPDSDPRTVCSGNGFLEVGDPQGNGPTFDDYPAIVVPIDGVNYHLQQLVLYQWFTDEVPSSAQNGWYTYPNPSSLTVPAVYCK